MSVRGGSISKVTLDGVDVSDYIVSTDVEPPKPTNWLTYGRDVRPQLGNIVGPNLFGEHYAVVSEDFDAETGKTRLGFCILPIVLKSGWRPPVPA